MRQNKRLTRRRFILWMLNLFITVPLIAAMAEAILLTSPPRFAPEHFPEDYDISYYESVTFRTDDGLLLDAWYMPPSREDGASILFVHGQAGNKGQQLPKAAWFYSMGYGILLFDLRAHGESAGTFASLSLLETQDVATAYAFLRLQAGVNPERIAIYGHSMGGATSIRAMPNLDGVRVLILDAPFADLHDAIAGDIEYYGFPPLFIPDIILRSANLRTGLDFYQARPIDVITQIEQPIFLAHGTADDTVPTRHAYSLYEQITSPKMLYIVEGAAHTEVYEHDPDAFKAAILPFLDEYFINP